MRACAMLSSFSRHSTTLAMAHKPPRSLARWRVHTDVEAEAKRWGITPRGVVNGSARGGRGHRTPHVIASAHRE